MTTTAKLPESPEKLLEQVRQRGLSAYYWDNQLHFLPAKLASANRDLIDKLHRQREAVRRELNKERLP